MRRCRTNLHCAFFFFFFKFNTFEISVFPVTDLIASSSLQGLYSILLLENMYVCINIYIFIPQNASATMKYKLKWFC